MSKLALKVSKSSQLPAWFGTVSDAIKGHKKFRDFHDDARELAVKLGAGKMESGEFLQKVQAHRQATEEIAVKLVEKTGFQTSHTGERAYAEVMGEIERNHSEHFKVISACWALEHGLTNAKPSSSLQKSIKPTQSKQRNRQLSI